MLQIANTNTSKTLVQVGCNEQGKFPLACVLSRKNSNMFGAKTPPNNDTWRQEALWGRVHGVCTVHTVLDNYTAFTPQMDPHRKVPDSIS